MLRRISLVVAVVFCVLISISFVNSKAFCAEVTAEQEANIQTGLDNLTQALELSDSQASQIKEIMMKGARDFNASGKNKLPPNERRAAAMNIRAAHDAEIVACLTDDQKVKYEEYKAVRAAQSQGQNN